MLDRFEFPGTDPVVRAGLEVLLAEEGAEAMHARLAEKDPVAALAIQPSNGRRVVRALEVVHLTGRPFSATLPRQEYFYDGAVQVGLDIDRPTLDDRIARRVEQMRAAGLVEEVRGLVAAGLREGRTAQRALGYQQVLAFLDGELSEDEAFEQTVDRHPPVRPQAGRVVPQGPSDHVAGLGRPGAGGGGRVRRTGGVRGDD